MTFESIVRLILNLPIETVNFITKPPFGEVRLQKSPVPAGPFCCQPQKDFTTKHQLKHFNLTQGRLMYSSGFCFFHWFFSGKKVSHKDFEGRADSWFYHANSAARGSCNCSHSKGISASSNKTAHALPKVTMPCACGF